MLATARPLATMSHMSLHEELTTYTFASWHIHAIVHALIEVGRVIKLECMAETCARETREFAKSGHRGQGDLLTIDHIKQRGEGGSHRLENLRILHLSCNSSWRKGRPGTFHTDETKERLRQTTRQAHADGKMKKIYTPERSEKIRQAKRNNPLSEEAKRKIGDAQRGRPKSPEHRAKISAAFARKREEKK